jgi:hypothetical protein
VSFVPRRDLMLPTKERATETSGLFGQLGVLKIVAEPLMSSVRVWDDSWGIPEGMKFWYEEDSPPDCRR